MKLLLDTCAFLWWTRDAPEFTPAARQLVTAPENDVLLSVVSIWEIVTKHARGRLTWPVSETPVVFVKDACEFYGIELITLRERDVMPLSTLGDIHRDPFDRMLVCQAIARDLVLLTPDEKIQAYPVRTRW